MNSQKKKKKKKKKNKTQYMRLPIHQLKQKLKSQITKSET